MEYLVGDFLIRLKNAARAGRREVVVPRSGLNLAVAKLLAQRGVLAKVVAPKSNYKTFQVDLNFVNQRPVLRDVQLFSKPGRRYYSGANELPFPTGKGMVIVSTSQGVMTAAEAKKLKIGGEVIAAVLLN